MLKDFNFDIKIVGQSVSPALFNATLTNLAYSQTIYFQLCELIAKSSGQSLDEVSERYEKLYNEACIGIQAKLFKEYGPE